MIDEYNQWTPVVWRATMRQTPVDVITEVAPVAAIAENPLVFAVASQSPIRMPADLVAAAPRRAPGRI